MNRQMIWRDKHTGKDAHSEQQGFKKEATEVFLDEDLCMDRKISR